MRECINDPFYELIKKHDRCVVSYCIMESGAPHRGEPSHRDAVLYAMLKMIERSIEEDLETEAKWNVPMPLFPWTLDIAKAEAAPINPAAFLFVPKILRTDRNGVVFYDSDWTPNDENCGGRIPYWYAFLEPPHGTHDTQDDLREINAALFPQGADALEVYEWTTNWSNYFDAGHEWWGASCWTVYDLHLDRYVALFASATD